MGNKNLFVVTIVGAESSGKTVLAKQLAEALGCKWVPEFAREYLENLDRPYQIEDLEEIANGQSELMKAVQATGYPVPIPAKANDIDDAEKKGIEIEDILFELKSRKGEILIVDSGIMTIRMWAKIKYNRSLSYVEEAMKNDSTSLYLLCRPRIDWANDPLREAPVLVDRVWIYNQYLKELIEQGFNFHIIKT